MVRHVASMPRGDGVDATLRRHRRAAATPSTRLKTPSQKRTPRHTVQFFTRSADPPQATTYLSNASTHALFRSSTPIVACVERQRRETAAADA